ncbi:MAG: phytoene desaturase family protein [Anaerolineae bacterium]|nr:phytoene desaturase family protein [Anaerolineae bacterium]
MPNKKKIIVIGSGLGGLAVACRLAAHGHEVKVFEKRDRAGGMADSFEINGFKFDGGPSAVTAPFLLEDIFEVAGKNLADYVELIPVEPLYRVFASPKKHFDLNGNEQDIFNQITHLSPGDAAGFSRYMEDTRQVYKKGFLDLITQNTLRLTDVLNLVPDLVKFPPYLNVYQHISTYVKNDLLRKALVLPTLMSGGSPFNTPSIYALQNYLPLKWGTYHVRGGFDAIIKALLALFAECGGSLWLNSPVSEILSDGAKVNGVRLADGSLYRADCVISDADLAYTYHNLIDEKHRRKYKDSFINNKRFSQSFFVIYFGTRRLYRESGLVHHNILLPDRFQTYLTDIFEQHSLPQEFLLHLQMPALTDESLSPPGCETFRVMASVPNQQSGIDWQKMARPYRDRIFQFLEENYLPDLRTHLVAEHHIDPLYFQNELNNYYGCAFSLQPTLSQTAWLRPHNRSEDFKNLYFVGAGTHPGAGIPAVLASASIVDRMIELSSGL